MNVIMPQWAPSERLQRLAERRGMALCPVVKYRTLGDALDAHPELSTKTRNLLLRACSTDERYYVDQIRATDWATVEIALQNDRVLRQKQLGPKALAELKRVLL